MSTSLNSGCLKNKKYTSYKTNDQIDEWMNEWPTTPPMTARRPTTIEEWKAKKKKTEKAMRDSIAVVGRWDEHICVTVGGDKGGRHTKSKSSGTQETGKTTLHMLFTVIWYNVTMVNFSDHTSYEEVSKYCHAWWMSSSIGQNPTFSCQQLVMKYCQGSLKFGWKIHW